MAAAERLKRRLVRELVADNLALRSRLPQKGAADASDVIVWIGNQTRKTTARGQGAAGWLARVEQVASREAPRGNGIWDVLGLPADMPAPPGATAEDMRTMLWAFAVTNTLLIAVRHHKRAGENHQHAHQQDKRDAEEKEMRQVDIVDQRAPQIGAVQSLDHGFSEIRTEVFMRAKADAQNQENKNGEHDPLPERRQLP